MILIGWNFEVNRRNVVFSNNLTLFCLKSLIFRHTNTVLGHISFQLFYSIQLLIYFHKKTMHYEGNVNEIIMQFDWELDVF